MKQEWDMTILNLPCRTSLFLQHHTVAFVLFLLALCSFSRDIFCLGGLFPGHLLCSFPLLWPWLSRMQ